MPGSVKIKIIAAKNLPVMDRSTFLTDAFVEVRIGNEFYKTDVVKRSLNPQWNSDWIIFELDDQQLQEEVLQIRVLDHDTYSAHDSIGRVYIGLNALLVKKKNRCFSGWLSIYDTMHGIRGEINVAVKVDLFSDVSKFRQSSVGVKFFYSSCIPVGFNVITLFGFVEELVMMDDPEHQWREKLRTSRASNETRQRLFSKLSGELQRKMGVKVLEMGGNSVIGYQLHFDLEGETGVVIRGIGTVAELYNINKDSSSPPTSPVNLELNSDNDNLFESKSSSFTKGVDEAVSSKPITPSIPPIIRKKLFDFGVFPFLTISLAPSNFLKHFGSVVSVKSVKLIEKNPNGDERACRDAWWSELRTEIASHMRIMNCNAVLGYSENCIIDEDVCVLTGYGTAVFIDTKNDINSNGVMSDVFTDKENVQIPEMIPSNIGLKPSIKESNFTGPHPPYLNIDLAKKFTNKRKKSDIDKLGCQLCHLPGGIEGCTFSTVSAVCRVCNQVTVPEVIFSTTEIPEMMEFRGKPSLIQARVCRYKKENKGELCAKEINDILPFLEYEMHYKLVQNLSMKGMNAIFGLKIRLCLGENLVVAIGTGTGVFLPPLPDPIVPKSNHYTIEEENLILKMSDFRALSREFFNIETNINGSETEKNTKSKTPPEEISQLNSSTSQCLISNRIFTRNVSDSSRRTSLTDTVFIDTGELNSDYINTVIREGFPPPEITMETTNSIKCKYSSIFPQMIFRFVRSIPLVSIDGSGSIGSLTSERLDTFMQQFNATLLLKLRRLMPCIVSGLDYTFNVTEDDGFETMVTGFVTSTNLQTNGRGDSAQCQCIGSDTAIYTAKSDNVKTNETALIELTENPPLRFLISPLSSVTGYSIDAYLGSLNFFFVRETTSLREFGGVSGFIQSLIGEVQSVVASHTMAIGGSGLLSCHISEMVLNYPTNGRQMNSAQCLINICGDMVLGHF